MSWLDKLERKLGGAGIPHLTEILILGQVAVFFAALGDYLSINNLLLIPELVRIGEYRRLFTFLFIPPSDHPIFIAFAWYLFYLMGNALEEHWGEFRYTLFILVAYLSTVAAAFLMPAYAASNAYIGGSVFLAFAYLYPDFELYLFFILPVKIKWLALLTWLTYGWTLLFGSWHSKLLMLASVLNFILFFGKDLLQTMRAGKRRMAADSKVFASSGKPLHRCGICGKDSLARPDLEFRYCSQCEGEAGYCPEHLRDHSHTKTSS